MVGLLESPGLPSSGLGYSISHQKVELDIDLLSRSLKGKTEITVNPHSKDLRSVRLNCRQCQLKRLSVNGKPATSMSYEEPYRNSKLSWRAGVYQYQMLRQRIEGQVREHPEEELIVNLPRNLRIDELDPFSNEALGVILQVKPDSNKRESGGGSILDLAQTTKTTIEPTARFTPIVLYIEFVIEKIRDGMQFVGWEDGDPRYPHAYTQKSLSITTCCLFPCLEDISSRCTWEISIKCPRTLGDAFQIKNVTEIPITNGLANEANGNDSHHTASQHSEGSLGFNDEEKALDLAVLCSGDLTDEVDHYMLHSSLS